jgi:hypothetical protein
MNVEQCKESYVKSSQFFGFPQTENIRQQWIEYLFQFRPYLLHAIVFRKPMGKYCTVIYNRLGWLSWLYVIINAMDLSNRILSINC